MSHFHQILKKKKTELKEIKAGAKKSKGSNKGVEERNQKK